MRICFNALGAALCILFAAATGAQSFPGKSIRFIVPYSPGGSTDFTARIIAQKLSDIPGWQVIVDNRPGASGRIGGGIAANSAPDGYTLCMIALGDSINASLFKKSSYHLLTDFATVSQVSTSSYLIVAHPSLQAKTIQELIAVAKARPDPIIYGSGGGGSWMSTELFKIMAGIRMTYIPYKSSGQALNDLLGNEISLMFSAPPAVLPHVRTGRLAAIAVTGARRASNMPEIPTVAEAGFPQYDVSTWTGVVVPAGVPADIVAKLYTAIAKVLNTPDVKALLARAGGNEVVASTPEQFRAFLKNEVAKWANVIDKANIPLQ
ncbi:MAG: tripartite tricarboxylate transporter substrate binding protein [Betaproteobacteria bacterium]|nr:tripartite tricarboxylate transporter substrate binding protein [Betaproteobacteria bacterium]MBI4189526.1 tripartite tricarboxylate transporter substrate binding protein [Betaproteobacteria bacterium]